MALATKTADPIAKFCTLLTYQEWPFLQRFYMGSLQCQSSKVRTKEQLIRHRLTIFALH